jgi:hypothetical protein
MINVDNEEKVKKICAELFQSREMLIEEQKMDSLLQEVKDKNEILRMVQKNLNSVGLTLARIKKENGMFYILISEGIYPEMKSDDYALLALLKIFFDEFGDNQPKQDLEKVFGKNKNDIDRFIREDFISESANRVSASYKLKIMFQKIPSNILKKLLTD